MAMGRRVTALLLTAALSTTLLAGCELGSGSSTGPSVQEVQRFLPEDPAELTVMTYGMSTFTWMGGREFRRSFPNVDISVASTQLLDEDVPGVSPKQELTDFIRQHRPDVLQLTLEQYRWLLEQGELVELDGLIKRDGFDLDGLDEALLDQLRSAGDGALYGLAPAYTSTALYYNRERFRQFGMPEPTAGMTWKDILELAAQFPDEKVGSLLGGSTWQEPLYGLAADHARKYEFAIEIGASYGLSMVDADAYEVKVNSDAWRSVFEMMLDGVKRGTIVFARSPRREGRYDQGEVGNRNHFAYGYASMTVSTPSMFNSIVFLTQRDKDKVGIVPAPADPNVSGYGNRKVTEIYAIAADSPNKGAAWELVKHLNSAEVMQQRGLSSDDNMRMRSVYNTDRLGLSMEPFNAHGIASFSPDASHIAGTTFEETFGALVEAELDLVLAGNQTLDEAMAKIEEEGQQALDRALQEAAQAQEPTA